MIAVHFHRGKESNKVGSRKRSKRLRFCTRKFAATLKFQDLKHRLARFGTGASAHFFSGAADFDAKNNMFGYQTLTSPNL